MLVFAIGCAGPGPSGFPPALPATTPNLVAYDVDGDQQPDLQLHLNPTGGMQRIEVAGQESEYPANTDLPHLVLILDSIPLDLMQEAYRSGWFRMLRPPSGLVSPFPVMTDVALAELYDVFPLAGVESQFLRDGKLNDATGAYLDETNMPWTARMNYRMEPLGHAFAYSNPYPWLGHELGRIERRGLQALRDGSSYTAYVVGTSALGSHAGRTGHLFALRQVEQLCLRILYEMQGAVRITLLSDHGHDYDPGTWFSLRQALQDAGFRTGTRRGPEIDAIVPEWGLVTCAAIFGPNPEELARHTILLEGVEHCLLQRADEVLVYGRNGSASITLQGEQLCYAAGTGDPFELLAADQRQLCLTRTEWLERTSPSAWPDSVPRSWDAFQGRFVEPPDVLVSLAPGYYVGSPDLRKRLEMQATHGSLQRAGSVGFVMSSSEAFPPWLTMRSLRDHPAFANEP